MSSCHQLGPVVRKAQPADIPDIHSLIESLSGDGTLLRRSLREIEQHIETFIVAASEDGEGGEFLGCAALHRYGAHLAEVRSIALLPSARGIGAGGLLLERLLDDVRCSRTRCACLFTRIPDFFEHYGFHAVPLAAFADKVAKDCIRCPRRESCDETAMALGELPSYMPPQYTAASSLVQL